LDHGLGIAFDDVKVRWSMVLVAKHDAEAAHPRNRRHLLNMSFSSFVVKLIFQGEGGERDPRRQNASVTEISAITALSSVQIAPVI
jgi:hypothetical protein